MQEVQNEIQLRLDSTRSNGQVFREVSDRLAEDPWVDERRIRVEAEEGKVELIGSVGSPAAKAHAYADSWVEGVQTVDTSHLLIDPTLAEAGPKARGPSGFDFASYRA